MHARFGRRRFVLGGAAALLLAACGGTTAPTPPAAAPTSAPAPAATTAPQPAATPAAAKPNTAPAAGGAEVTFWGHNHTPRVDLDKEILDTFLKEQGNGAKVEYVVVPQEYEVKLTTAMAAGTGPDGYNLTSSYTYPFMAKGFAAEVDPTPWNMNTPSAVADLYVKGALDAFTYQGKLYGIVSEYSNYALFLNTKLFKDGGVDVTATPPKTWDDVVEISKKVVKRQGDVLTQRGFDFTYMTQQGRQTSPFHTMIGMAYQLGGEFFDADKKTTNINSDPFIRAMQFQQDFIYKEKLGSPSLLGSNGAFQQGTVGATLSGYWSIAPTKKDYPDVAAVLTATNFPQFKDAKRKSGAALYGYARMVNAKSSDAARGVMWKLHKAWSSNPQAYMERAGLLQPTKEYVSSDAFKKLPLIQVFLDDAQGTPFAPQHLNSIEITNAAIRGMERITQEKADVKASLDQAKKEIDDIIAKG
ncbi:MAG TPA: extracellular solute-binding protein [Chloroflexota bacterium]|nr:extracellular solute-binding protein [Chloroflexota bacterium]